jgi:hypothetical protein
VLLDYLGLLRSFCLSGDFNLEGSQDLAKCARVIMEKRLAQVVEILRSEFNEHLELRLLDLFEDIFVIEGPVKLRLCLSTGDSCPFLRLDE